MEHLYAPWRMEYIGGEPEPGCLFCRALADPKADLVVDRPPGAHRRTAPPGLCRHPLALQERRQAKRPPTTVATTRPLSMTERSQRYPGRRRPTARSIPAA